MAEPYVLSDEEAEYAAEQFLGVELLPEEETEFYGEDEEEGDYIAASDGVRVSGILPSDSGLGTSVFVEEERCKRRRVGKRGVKCLPDGDESRLGSQGSQWNRSEIEGLFCSICMEVWTNEGDHHICCLPCGHLFGFSCIKKWLQQSRNSAKCPQCNGKCTLKGVRKLFAPRIVVVDEESQKRIRSLEVKCASLEKKDADWCNKESEWQKREADLQLKVNQLKERTTYLEHLLGDLRSRPSGFLSDGNVVNSKFCGQNSSSNFVLQKELRVDDARLFDIDASGQILLLARRLPRMGGSHVLTKMSLISPYEIEDIYLPSSNKIVKDLKISPFDGSLALCASLGKKLSVLSLESNNVILSYDLPAAAWSCTWDLNSSQHIYAGLQNGLLLMFDLRQTMKPIESRLGLTTNPIHTIHSLQHNSALPSGVRGVLSASSIGICQWNFDSAEERPSLVPETENLGVCISLAYCPKGGDIVASYRPRVQMSDEMVASQPLLTPSPVIGQGLLGSLLHLKRVGNNYEKLGIACGTVSDIRLPKSTVISKENQKPLFAAGDEATCELVLQELPSFTVAQRLKPHRHFICDVKYTSVPGQGLLSCLSENTLQLFSTKLP